MPVAFEALSCNTNCGWYLRLPSHCKLYCNQVHGDLAAYCKVLSTLTAIGIQAKKKFVISLCQISVTVKPSYGIVPYRTLTSWFKVFNIFDFNLIKVFGLRKKCLGSMKTRLLLDAGWPFLACAYICSRYVYSHGSYQHSVTLKKRHPFQKIVLLF